MPSNPASAGGAAVGGFVGAYITGGAASRIGEIVGSIAQGTLTGRPYTLPIGLSPPPPAAGWMMLATADAGPNDKALYVRTTREPTLPTSESGWSTVELPSRVDATRWTSGKPLRFDAEISLNSTGVPPRAGQDPPDVEDEWRYLVSLWRPRGGAKPPPLRLAGPVSRTDLPWVITDVQPNQDTLRRRGNRLVRVEATLSFSQYVNPGVPQITVREGDDQATEDRPNFTISKDGDTLRQIAKRPPPDGLGDGRKWVELRKLNPAYKTANQHIPTGTRIRLPNG